MVAKSEWLNDEDFMDLLEFGSNEDFFRAVASNQLLHPDMPYRIYTARKPLIDVVLRYRVEMEERNGGGQVSINPAYNIERRHIYYEYALFYQLDGTYEPHVLFLKSGEEVLRYIKDFQLTGKIIVYDPSTDTRQVISPAMVSYYKAQEIYRLNGAMLEHLDDLRENMKMFIHQYELEVT